MQPLTILSPLKKLISILFLCLCAALSAQIDLEEEIPPFVLETKRIKLLPYPDAFNPSIVEWKGEILLSFRSRNPDTGVASRVGFVRLNKDFDPIQEPFLLDTGDSYIQDPRLYIHSGRLYMAYSDLIDNPPKRRMCIAELIEDNNELQLHNPQFLLKFNGDAYRKFEKNWTPFVHDDTLFLSYTLFPHKVFIPFPDEQRCTTLGSSKTAFTWNRGEIRGGTPALLIDGFYLGFFHSSIEMATLQSKDATIPHYFMGAYTFSANPPFRMTSISPKPIIGRNFYNGKSYQTWKPLRVVFPGGFLFNDEYIWIAYGRQDHEIWIVKLDRKGLMESLIPTE